MLNLIKAKPKKEVLDIPWLSWDEFTGSLNAYNEGSKTFIETFLENGLKTKDGAILWVTLDNPNQFALIEYKASLRKGAQRLSQGSIRCFESQEDSIPALSGQINPQGELIWRNQSHDPSWKRLQEVLNPKEALQPIDDNIQPAAKALPALKTQLDTTADKEVKYKDGIRWVTLHEFKDMTSQWADLPSFQNRFKAFKQNMTYQDGRYALWFSFEQDYSHAIQMELKPEPTFDSNTFAQSTSIPNITGLKKPHWGFYLQDMSKQDIPPYINWEIASNGHCSELYFISSGKYARGNQVMDLFKHLQSCLKTDNVYIQDDARNVDDQRLRLLRPLTHRDGQTWYQSHGFSLLACKNLLDDKGKHLYHQSPEKHQQAVQTLRDMPLKHLQKILKGPDSQRVHKCANKYLPGFAYDDVTLSQLSSEVFHQSTSDSRSSRRAKLELTFLYDCFLRPDQLPKNPKDEPINDYVNAVNEVFDSRIFVLK